MKFNEAGEVSTIERFAGHDRHADSRKHGAHYLVESVSLNDLLKQHRAPKRVDYLSIDTEGSELAILQGFDFDAYDVRIITVEHNSVQENRRGLHALLSAKGYQRKFECFSQWDDWYVRS